VAALIAMNRDNAALQMAHAFKEMIYRALF
jgi:hypothetical protein